MPYKCEYIFAMASAAVILTSCAALGPPPAAGPDFQPAVSNTRMQPQSSPRAQSAAHSAPAPRSFGAVPRTAAADAAALVEDAAAFGALDAAERQQRLKAADEDYRKQGGPDALLRLALYSAVTGPGAPSNDGLRADLKAYIEQARSSGDDERLLPLAEYAAALLDQRDELLHANTALQQKLNELKAIEERLNGHDQRETIRIAP